ncbi:DUF3105 domain-containing protein [Kitasatospora sp. DSM 101779]|uniref:DUF3105 domain-containing protein n=1 Tax=Kitasatospora sp. DSM 101779 TaxID=2853165 RepID=UPI0021D9951A|nr:DUF3105 domain-containing protein [Kitasatospora sp. DSM 101779]MCU7825459.1 DUF3105 domain-containing protein [Kitasatospora sp. DSM 101779]
MGSASRQSKPSKQTSGNPGNRQSPNERQADRRARIAELRAAEQKRDRRNKIVIFGLAGVLLAGMIGAGTWIALDAKHDKDAKEAAAKAPIQGVQTWDNLSRNHVETKVTYAQTPPVGGDHNPRWANCMGDVYDKPLANENAVHSLEHGAVWVTYNSKASADDIKKLSEKVKATPYTFMSPYPDEKSPITLSAWGTQLNVDSASDPRVEQFFTKYVQGPQTQEPGASCSSGVMP